MAVLTFGSINAAATGSSAQIGCKGQIIYIDFTSANDFTLVGEVSNDGGTTWKDFPLAMIVSGANITRAPIAMLGSVGSFASGPLDVAGHSLFRVKATNGGGGANTPTASYRLVPKSA